MADLASLQQQLTQAQSTLLALQSQWEAADARYKQLTAATESARAASRANPDNQELYQASQDAFNAARSFYRNEFSALDTQYQNAKSQVETLQQQISAAQATTVSGPSSAADPAAAANVSTSNADSVTASEQPLSDQEKANLAKPLTPGDAVDTSLGRQFQVVGALVGDDISATSADPLTVTVVGADRVADVGEGSAVPLKPIPNRLKQYPSYIYALSLDLVTVSEYNDLVLNQNYTPKHVLVASAGRYSETLPRNEFFANDFYFDDFNLNTVIAPNDLSRNTNAVDMSFTLIEPYGFTFIQNLQKACDKLGIKNYLDISYLLQIEFFAIGEDGSIVGSIEELKKRIPIKLVTVDVNISTRGSEYKITAVPYSHSAYDVTTVSTPANFEIAASDVRGFFQSIEGTQGDELQQALDFQNEQQRRETEEKNRQVIPKTFSGGKLNVTQSGVAEKTINPTYSPGGLAYFRAGSYGSAINAWYKALKIKNKIEWYDTYKFEFIKDPEGKFDIGAATFISQDTNSPRKTPMQDDQIKMRRADTGVECSIYEPDKTVFQINRGTTIEKLLEYVIRNSSYILDQLAVPESSDYEQQKETYKDKPLNWFKIIPTIRITKFDSRRGIYSREITYTVKPYKIYNLRSEVGPQGVQRNPVKIYNYIFTGKNDDIIDFDLKFNVLYYMQYTAYRDNLTSVYSVPGGKLYNYEDTNSPNYAGARPRSDDGSVVQDPNSVMPSVIKYTVQNSPQVATGDSIVAKKVAAADLNDSILTRSYADMVNVKLKILGDPDFIKQDDIYFRPPTEKEQKTLNRMPSVDPRLLPGNNSLIMDDGGVYVQILFNTGRDYNESTGLIEEINPEYNTFSGLYQVVTVANQFSNGIFTQELDLVRLPRQVAYDHTTYQPAGDNNRPQDGATVDSQGQLQKPPAPTVDTATENSIPPSTAQQADTAAAQQPGQDQPVAEINNQPVGQSQTQQELATVRDTAPTQDINASNEPAASAGISKEDQLISDVQDNLTKQLSTTDPAKKLEIVNDSADKWRTLQTIYENQGDYARAAVARREWESSLQQRAQLRERLGL